MRNAAYLFGLNTMNSITKWGKNYLVTTLLLSGQIQLPKSTKQCTNTSEVIQSIIFSFRPKLMFKENLWPDLQKGVFHMHQIVWLWRTITWCCIETSIWNLYHSLHFVNTLYCKNFKSIAFTWLKLWIVEVGNSYVCGRTLFVNPVTFLHIFL